MAFASDIRSFEASLVERTTASLRAAASRYAKHRLYRRTVRELDALSGAELADLGLSRSMIKGIALEAVYGA